MSPASKPDPWMDNAAGTPDFVRLTKEQQVDVINRTFHGAP